MNLMELEKYNTIEKIFASYDDRVLKDSIGVFDLLKKNKISMEDFRWFTKKLRKDFTSSFLISRLCPECGEKLVLYGINEEQGPRNLFGYRSRWFCDVCGFEKLSKAPPMEELIRTGGENAPR